MKLRIERDVFAETVGAAARSLAPKPPVPVLAGLLLDAVQDGPLAGGTLKVSAFDYEVSAQIEASADVVTPGRVLVSGRMLSDIAKSLPAKPVDLAVDGSRATLTCGASKFTLLTMPVDEYPTLPDLPTGSGTVDGGVFAAAVAQVATAASKDGTLPLLTGVRVAVDGATLTLMATDRYRLAVSTIGWEPSGDHTGIAALIPARALTDMARTLSSGVDVTMALGVDMVGFEVGRRRSTSLLIDGEYPKVQSLFPQIHDGYAVVEVAPLVEAVKRVALVAERNTPVGLSFTDDRLVVEAGRGEDAQGVDEVEGVTLAGVTEMVQRFNPQYLLDGLSGLSTPYARLSFTTPTKPAVITGQVEPDGDDDVSYRYLLMPVRV